MNFRELHEADYPDFSDQAEKTLSKVGALAKGAFQKFKAAKDKAEAGVKGDVQQAAKDAEAAKAQADKDAAATTKAGLLAKAGPKTAPITVAGIILDRTPEEGDLPELDDLDAEHFVYVQNATDHLQQRFDKFIKNLAKVMRTAQFINAMDRKEVPERLGDQDDRTVEASETMLMQNKFGERNAWMLALTNDDPNVGAKALLSVIGKISAQHGKLNQAQAKKVYADGLNLINVLGAQRQVIELRLGLFKAALDQLSKKPAMNEALLRRVGRLAKRL